MIAYRMLYAVAVGLPVLLSAHLVAGVLRRHGRAERGVWVGALVLALLLPAAFMAGPFDALRVPGGGGSDVVAAAVDDGDSDPGPALQLPTIVVLRSEGARSTLDRLMALAWVLASLGLTLRWVVSTRRLARISSDWRADRVDGSDVWITAGSGPAVTGALRSRILVPDWLLQLPDDQRGLVLLHEEEHVRAGDPWLMTLSRLARIATPWNAVVWVLTSRLLRAVETDCDRRVLRLRPDVRTYCDTLFAISARKPSRLVGAAAFAESQIPLQKRILAMTTPPRRLSAVAVAALLAVGTLLVVGSCGVPVPTERAVEQQASVSENPDWLQVVVAPDGSVTVDGEAHAMSEVTDVVAERVAESQDPLVTSIRVREDVPYRFVDELQQALVKAGAIRVVFHVDGATGAPDGGDGLAIVLPDLGMISPLEVSQRNVLKLHVLSDGAVEVRRGTSSQTQFLRAGGITGLWRQDVAENERLIAAINADPNATYTQVMAVLDALYAAKAQRVALLGVTGL